MALPSLHTIFSKLFSADKKQQSSVIQLINWVSPQQFTVFENFLVNSIFEESKVSFIFRLLKKIFKVHPSTFIHS